MRHDSHSAAGWQGLSGWWLDEVAGDPAYEEVVTPLVKSLLGPTTGTVLDVGCGDGRLFPMLTQAGLHVVGVDVDLTLLSAAAIDAPVARLELPHLDPLAESCVDAAVISLVLEHLDDHETVFAETARVVRSGGILVLVINHPIFTAPESAPIVDEDGETLWRPGEYFSRGHTDEPAGQGVIRFHHRTMADLLTSAARAGWILEEMIEMGVTDAQIERTPWLADQRHIPRLLGCRWINGSSR